MGNCCQSKRDPVSSPSPVPPPHLSAQELASPSNNTINKYNTINSWSEEPGKIQDGFHCGRGIVCNGTGSSRLELVEFTNDHTCDICKKEYEGDEENVLTMYSCVRCDYDVCLECRNKRSQVSQTQLLLWSMGTLVDRHEEKYFIRPALASAEATAIMMLDEVLFVPLEHDYHGNIQLIKNSSVKVGGKDTMERICILSYRWDIKAGKSENLATLLPYARNLGYVYALVDCVSLDQNDPNLMKLTYLYNILYSILPVVFQLDKRGIQLETTIFERIWCLAELYRFVGQTNNQSDQFKELNLALMMQFSSKLGLPINLDEATIVNRNDVKKAILHRAIDSLILSMNGYPPVATKSYDILTVLALMLWQAVPQHIYQELQTKNAENAHIAIMALCLSDLEISLDVGLILELSKNPNEISQVDPRVFATMMFVKSITEVPQAFLMPTTYFFPLTGKMMCLFLEAKIEPKKSARYRIGFAIPAIQGDYFIEVKVNPGNFQVLYRMLVETSFPRNPCAVAATVDWRSGTSASTPMDMEAHRSIGFMGIDPSRIGHDAQGRRFITNLGGLTLGVLAYRHSGYDVGPIDLTHEEESDRIKFKYEESRRVFSSGAITNGFVDERLIGPFDVKDIDDIRLEQLRDIIFRRNKDDN